MFLNLTGLTGSSRQAFNLLLRGAGAGFNIIKRCLGLSSENRTMQDSGKWVTSSVKREVVGSSPAWIRLVAQGRALKFPVSVFFLLLI